MIFRKMSFKLKLILIISIINVIIVSLTLLIRSIQIEESFKERMQFRTGVIANIIIYSIDDETKLDREIINRYSDYIIHEPEIQYVTFYNKYDKLINTVGDMKAEKSELKTEDIMNLKDDTYDVYKKIIGKNGKKIGSIVIGFSMQSLKDIMRKTLITGILVWLFAIILILIFNYISITVFLKPLRELFLAAESVSEKDFNYKILVNSNDEIGQISNQFNLMTQKLKNFYVELDQKIKEATVQLLISNRQLIEIGKRKTEFISTVSHDLRTPITSIMGFADTLLNKELKLTEQDKERYLNIISTESKRITRLISDFLDITKIEADKLELNMEEIDIKELVNNIVKTIFTKTKEVKIHVESDSNIPKIKLDRNRIMQCLHNIIGNALKYSPQNTTINIRFKQYSDKIEISIADNGIGISDEEKEKIFEKFYRIDNDISRKEQGSGLGLAITKSIIEMHKGKIWIEDNKPTGSCFILTLPI